MFVLCYLNVFCHTQHTYMHNMHTPTINPTFRRYSTPTINPTFRRYNQPDFQAIFYTISTINPTFRRYHQPDFQAIFYTRYSIQFLQSTRLSGDTASFNFCGDTDRTFCPFLFFLFLFPLFFLIPSP